MAAPQEIQGAEVQDAATGGGSHQAGNEDGAAVATQNTQGDGDGANKARKQNAWDRDGANGFMAPLLAAARAKHGGNREAAGGRRRGTAERTPGTIVPTAMVAAAAPLGWEGHPENPRGALNPTAFLSLTDSTQLAGLRIAPQGVACLTNKENWGRQSDNMTNRTTGGEGRNPPPMGSGMGEGRTGSGRAHAGDPSTTREDSHKSPRGG